MPRTLWTAAFATSAHAVLDHECGGLVCEHRVHTSHHRRLTLVGRMMNVILDNLVESSACFSSSIELKRDNFSPLQRFSLDEFLTQVSGLHGLDSVAAAGAPALVGNAEENAPEFSVMVYEDVSPQGQPFGTSLWPLMKLWGDVAVDGEPDGIVWLMTSGVLYYEAEPKSLAYLLFHDMRGDLRYMDWALSQSD